MDQSQQLQLMSEKKLLKLEQNNQDSHIKDEPMFNTNHEQSMPTNPQNTPDQRQKSIFKRLFHID